MSLPTLVITILAFGTFAFAQQQFEITALSSKLPVGPPAGTGDIDSSLSITMSYPDPSDTTSALKTICSHSWSNGDSPGPTDWEDCADSEVQWRLPTDGWTSQTNYRVEAFSTLNTSESAGLDGSHILDMNPGSSDPNAYLSCIQMGKFQPLTCQLGGPLSVQSPPVVITANEVTARPN